MASGGFQVIEHTADTGIESWGRTLAEAFEHAARGLYALMVDLDRVEPRETREVDATAPDLERLLVAWLTELLFLTESEDVVFSSFDVEVERERCALHAQISGEPLDPDRHDAAYDVKAVTYHGLSVVEEPAGWRCRVIVDV